MSADQTLYDVFISYARKDNAPIPTAYPHGWVAAIRDHIAADHRQFSTAPLRLFFDTLEIKDADDWRFRILGALKHSKLLVVCLSPNYFASVYCRWEWEEYLQRQVHRLMGSESVATVYFVEVPGSDEQANARRVEELLRGNFTDLRPWFPEGAEALQKEEVRRRLARLGESLWERLQRARRATDVPGNLRWQNPHFVGRNEELRKLHEQLGTGAVGVVTAVQGLGGQGKTELAVAYAHGWADWYPAGLWSLAAEGKKELLPLIGELAWERALGFTPSEAEKSDPVLLGRGVLAHLQARAAAVRDATPDRAAAALLLLDNVSDPDLLAPAQLATLPGGMGAGWLRIVATTRLDLREQKDRLSLLAVDALDEDSALSLIRDHQPPRDAQRRVVPDLSQGQPQFASEVEETAARQVVRALGGFTLAVEQVALYLGLHPEVAPSAFFTTLTARGLPVADTLPQRDPDVAAQMHTQSKQLALILDATLARLDAPARTALAFAALLPPDHVPWPWLRDLTVARHPELAEKDDLGADPWFGVRRRLAGLRLLTSGDHPEIARIHRLVAAHLASPSTVPPADEPSTSPESALEAHLTARAKGIYLTQSAPADWELDALLVAAPHWLAGHPVRDLVNASVFLVEKIITYRTLVATAAFLAPLHEVLAKAAASDPSNTEWQRDLCVIHRNVGDVRLAQGDLAGALQAYGQSQLGMQRLAAADPSNASLQWDLSASQEKMGNVRLAQGDLAGALRAYRECQSGMQRVAAADTSNARCQRDLSVIHKNVGDVLRAQGDLAGALRAYRECQSGMQRLAAADPSNVGWQRDLSASHSRVGNVLTAQGDLVGALQAYREYQSGMQRLAAADPSNAGWQRDLSASHNNVGGVLLLQGDLAGALQAYREFQSGMQRLAAADPTNADWQRDLSVSHNNVGDVLRAQGNLAGALIAYQEYQSGMQRLAAADSFNADRQRDLSASHNKVGDVLREQGDLDGALIAFQESLAATARLAAADSSNADWQRELSVSHNKVGDVLREQGDPAGALIAFQESLAATARLAAADSSNARWQRELSVSHSKVGDVLLAQSDLVGALSAYTNARTIISRLAAADPSNAPWQRELGVSHSKVGDVLLAQGDLIGALSACTNARTIISRLAAADPSNVRWQCELGILNDRIGSVLQAQGDLVGALSAYTNTRTIISRLAAADPSNTGWQQGLSASHNNVGDVRLAQGDLAGALQAYRESLAVATRLAAADPANLDWQGDLSVGHMKLGDVLSVQGDLVGAFHAYVESLKVAAWLAPQDPSNADWQRNLCVGYWRMADVTETSGIGEARGWWRKAYEQLSGMKARGIMLPTDEKALTYLRQKAGAG